MIFVYHSCVLHTWGNLTTSQVSGLLFTVNVGSCFMPPKNDSSMKLPYKAQIGICTFLFMCWQNK